MKSVEKIKCFKCGVEIDVNEALSNEIEAKLKIDFSNQSQKYIDEIEKLQKEKIEIGTYISQEKDKEYKKRMDSEKEKIRLELSNESEERIKTLEKLLKKNQNK